MSLLIKGMDMPKYNGEHNDFDRYGCYLTVYKNGKVKLHICDTDYDVVEIPTPHGRLIDANRLIKALEKQWNVDDDQDFANKTVWRGIENAPTVIEKEMN